MSDEKNSDKPIYPIDTCAGNWIGLTKREYFAGLAMQGLLASSVVHYDDIVADAIKMADELLKQLTP